MNKANKVLRVLEILEVLEVLGVLDILGVLELVGVFLILQSNEVRKKKFQRNIKKAAYG